MRRSLLFIPANSPAMLQNADVFQADSVIFDLEDSVSIEEKDAARNLLVAYLNHFKHLNMEKIVRINGLDSPFFEADLNYILQTDIQTIMLPKATIENTNYLSKKLDILEKKLKKFHKVMILPIIELAQSLVEINEIAKISRVDGLLLGAEDLATNINVQRTIDSMEIFFARSMVVIAAKANQIDAIDTPFTDTQNESLLLKDAQFARSIGMNAKACIHPLQIDIVNEVFSPSLDEINYAKKVLLAYESAQVEKKGAFSVDGKMIDKPIIDRCRKTLELAEKFKLI